MTAVLSPDCAAGKCGACPGDGWDADRDWIAPCPCACHHVTHSELTARCDMTDLLVEECAHCTGRDGGEAAERKRKARLLASPSVIKAVYPGACSNCGEAFLAGEPIRSDWHGGWDAWCCL